FSDTSHISDFAFEAMTWAVENGLIQGNTSTTVNPLGKATRAEAAAILMRYKMWQEDGSQDR
ncbi:MAG: S-layer homology domain-containing protein, partial [Ruminiclostridium sp.]|nr:S-layer homology domain-containing protein [Ruminiclostridium sp.]